MRQRLRKGREREEAARKRGRAEEGQRRGGLWVEGSPSVGRAVAPQVMAV